jgi:hypothetical protein
LGTVRRQVIARDREVVAGEEPVVVTSDEPAGGCHGRDKKEQRCDRTRAADLSYARREHPREQQRGVGDRGAAIVNANAPNNSSVAAVDTESVKVTAGITHSAGATSSSRLHHRRMTDPRGAATVPTRVTELATSTMKMSS